MKKDLEIGTDYAAIAGYSGTGNKIIYKGNDTFELFDAKTGNTREITSKAQADKFREYINQPAVHMGL
jgi:hypothetical protein